MEDQDADVLWIDPVGSAVGNPQIGEWPALLTLRPADQVQVFVPGTRVEEDH